MDNRAIGIFDSGLGGLTTVKELRRLLPNENIVYFGDTGRVPYGTRSRDTIRKYAMQDIAFLMGHDVKMILAACGTASSVLTQDQVAPLELPFSGVVLPAAQAACAVTVNQRIGVVGTAATVHSGAYGRAIRAINPEVKVIGNACPLFVPLVESGFIQPDNRITTLVAELYLKPMQAEQVDTLILGCTHYPLIAPIIQQVLGEGVTLVDAGQQVARWAQNQLSREGMLREGSEGHCQFYVTDATDGFADIAQLYLGENVKSEVTQIDLDTL